MMRRKYLSKKKDQPREDQPPQDAQDVQDVQHGQEHEPKEPFTAEQLDYLKRSLGLENIPVQIKSLLEARDAALVDKIKIEMVKQEVNQPAPAAQGAGRPAASPGDDSTIGVIGKVAREIIDAVKENKAPSGDGQITGQIIAIALDNMKLSNQWMHKQLFGKIEIPSGPAKHASG